MARVFRIIIRWLREVWERWRDVIFTSGVDVILKALGLASGVLTARILLPEGKGELTAILLWVGIFHLFGTLGVAQAIVYYTGECREDVSVVAGTAGCMALVQGMLIGTAGYFAVPYILASYDSNVVSMAQVLFLWSPFEKCTSYAQRILHGLGEFRLWNVTRVLPNLIYVTAIVSLWTIGAMTVTRVVWGYLVGQAVVFLVVVGTLAYRLERIDIQFELAKNIVAYGGQNYLASLADQANHQLDQAVMSAYLGAKSLGLYRVAVSASKLIAPIGSGFQRVLLSSVSRAETEQDGDTLINESLRTAGPALLMAGICTAVAMPWLIPFAFGESYTQAIWPAVLLIFAGVVFGAKKILFNGLRGKNRPDIPFYAEVVALGVTGAGLFVLLEPLGITGAAIVSIVAYAVAFGVAWAFYRRGTEKESNKEGG